MAVSIANYPQTTETSNSVSVAYDDEKVSLASFLPQQALPRLPIFETSVVVPQQNGSVTNKNILSFNSKRNSFPRSLPRNSSSTFRHSICGDLPSQNRNNNKSSSVRRAASFGENSVVCNNNNNNNNNNSLTTTVTAAKSKPVTPLIIDIPSKVDKIDSAKSSPRSLKLSPKEKHSPKEKSSPEYSLNSSIMQHHHIEQKHEIPDSNYNNQNKSSSNETHNFSTDDVQQNQNQNDNNNIENNNIQIPQLIKSQPHNKAFFRHTITLNNNASGSSTDLRKSMYKEPSFTKKLRKVFSLSNIRQDDNNSASNSKFSSLRGKRHLYNSDDNHNEEDDTSVSSVSSNSDNNNNNKSRRRSFMDIQSFFSSNSKNKKKQKRQSHLKQQKKRSDDNKRDNSMDEMRGNDNINKEIQQNGNDYEQIDDSAPIPLRLSSLQSSDDGDSQQLQHQNSTSPLHSPFHINKSENTDDDSPVSSSSRPLSLPASAKNKETPSPTTPRRLSVPALKSNNSGVNAAHSVPSLVLFRDTDLPPASSTPSSMKRLQFSSTILIHETWTRDDYDRRGDQTTCNKLTPILAQRIKQELNDYKMDEMQVHEDSKNNTHFFAA